MCGFVGIFGPSAPVLGHRLAEATRRLHHRGPDSEGLYASPDGACHLGHRRLSIVDLSPQGSQPVARSGFALAYNGEIYNHQRLRGSHLSPQADFRSHSDTETLFHLLQAHAPTAILPELAGMYAGAFYAEAAQRLFLFRDNLGIKPLYLQVLPDSTLIFASEIRAILAFLPEVRPRCNAAPLAQYLTYENWPQGGSLFAGITLLEPGACLTARLGPDGSVTLHRETLPAPVGSETLEHPPQGDWVAYCRNAIEESVQAHLMSDVPLGAYLSGGIDSSLVTTLAVRQQADMMGFTGYFKTSGAAHEGDPWYDERPYTRQVARQAGIPLHEVAIGPEDFTAHFDAVIAALEEPRMGMGAFSQYVVAQEAARHRKVILAGHGGDELFGGYPLFKAFWMLEHFPAADAWKTLAGTRAKEWPWLLDMAFGLLRTGKLRFAPQLYPALAQRLAAIAPPARGDDDFQQGLQGSPLQQLNAYYLKTYLPGLLVVEDKISMAHSLETRIPLWSQPLYRQIMPIPMGEKLRQGLLKGLLKDVARGILPDDLLTAPKRGFPTPLRLWFRQELSSEIADRLLARESPLAPLVSRREVEKLLTAHRRQPLPFALDERRAHRIWMLLCLESWTRQFGVTLEDLAP